MILLQHVLELRDENLKTLSEKIIYLVIKEATLDQPWVAVSAKNFADALEMSDRAVFKVIRKLKERGLIEQNPDKIRHNSINEYRIKEK